ncbi:MAG TPA: hypothetical protein VFE30_09465 [Anaeromyxobacteraceae bacterium]|nr:hypothetical protein [Anaeromyxobacteraceae bacterium]
MDHLLPGVLVVVGVALLSLRRRVSARRAESGRAAPAGGRGADRLATLATRHQVLEDIQSHFEGRHVD